ncbi:NnrU family protein [Novosphingobium sp.]|uniref:NnrU family protein n=1 Tax=Novosphingobium sp. TaxID=1874826 RepID=UPI00343447A6
MLAVGMSAFVGTHLLMSHPWRASMVRLMGQGGFLGFYSIISLVTFSAAVIAFGKAPSLPQLWDGQALVPWILASLLTLVASVLFLASLVGNPALAGTDVAGLSTRLPSGVFKVTRHPMMSAFTLWGVAHIIVAPSVRTMILAGGVIALAVIGSIGQDAKKAALHGVDWKVWMRRTSFLPNPAAFGELKLYWIAAIPVWMLLTWLHLKMAFIPAGLWIWLEQY